MNPNGGSQRQNPWRMGERDVEGWIAEQYGGRAVGGEGGTEVVETCGMRCGGGNNKGAGKG